MKQVLLLVVLVALTTPGMADTRAASPLRRELLQQLQQVHRYDPTINATKTDEPTPADVVVLDTYVVEGRLATRDLLQRMERQEQLRRERRFSPVKGGTLLKAGPIELGTWGTTGGVNLINLSF